MIFAFFVTTSWTCHFYYEAQQMNDMKQLVLKHNHEYLGPDWPQNEIFSLKDM